MSNLTQKEIERLCSLDHPFAKGVADLLQNPSTNFLTEEERQLAIACMGAMKLLDDTWKTHTEAADLMGIPTDEEAYELALKDLKSLPSLFHALASERKKEWELS